MIYPIYAFIIKYRWFFALGSLVAFMGGVWLHGYFSGKAHERASMAQKQLNIQEERNAIANNRPDIAAVVTSLRGGTF